MYLHYISFSHICSHSHNKTDFFPLLPCPGFLGRTSGKEPTCQCRNLRDIGSIRGSGRSPGERNSSLLQYSYLENPMDRGAWQATIHRVTKSQTQLKQFSMQSFLSQCYEFYASVSIRSLPGQWFYAYIIIKYNVQFPNTAWSDCWLI